MATGAAILALVSLALPEDRPLVWNITHSVPTGLYLIGDAKALAVGDRVAIEPPADLRRLLAERRYLPVGVPLIKRVGARPGQRICRYGQDLTIDGQLAAPLRSHDRAGRPLPSWNGCLVLGKDEVFLLNPAQPDSFDSRYFGPLSVGSVTGEAHPLWTDERGDGGHLWRASPYTRPFPASR
jgi:conjugative transfer signal peptidase TraF